MPQKKIWTIPKRIFPGKLFSAELTLMGFDVVVDGLDVVLEIIGLLEGPLAHRTLERTNACNNVVESWKTPFQKHSFCLYFKFFKIW